MRIALVLLTSLFAYGSQMEQRLTTLEKQMMEVGTENVYGTFGAQFALPAYIDGFGCFLSMEPIFWFAKVGGTEYAYSGLSSSSNLPIQGKVDENTFDWDFGFKVSVGYVLVDDGYDVSLNYTWFDTSDSEASAKDQPSALYFLKSPLLFTMGQAAKSNYSIGYNELDAVMGRNYFVSGRLSFHPKIGLQGVWIDQRQKVRYFDVIADPSYGVVEIKNIDRCRFWGVGPTVSSESNWYLKHGFSLYSDMGAALLLGNFTISQNHSMTASEDPEGVDKLRVDLNGQSKKISPFFSIGLGVMWDTYLEENRARIMIGLGVEGNYLWAQNQTLTADHKEISGTDSFSGLGFKLKGENVAFSGINLKLRIDF
jgi:hypothetical protein